MFARKRTWIFWSERWEMQLVGPLFARTARSRSVSPGNSDTVQLHIQCSPKEGARRRGECAPRYLDVYICQ